MAMPGQMPQDGNWWSRYKTLDDAYDAGPDVYKQVFDTYKALSRSDVDDEVIRGVADRLGYAPVAKNEQGEIEDLSDMIKSRSAPTFLEGTQDLAAKLARSVVNAPGEVSEAVGSLVKPLGIEAPEKFGIGWQGYFNDLIPTSNEYRQTFAGDVGAAIGSTASAFLGGAGASRLGVKLGSKLAPGVVSRLGLAGKEITAARDLASATSALEASRKASTVVLSDIAKAQEALSKAQFAYKSARAANIARSSTYTGMTLEAGATGREARERGADPYTQLFAAALGAVAGSTEFIAGERLIRKIVDPGNLTKYGDVVKGIGQQIGGEVVEEELAAVPSALAQYLTETQGRSYGELLRENLISSAQITPFAVMPFSAVYGVRAGQMVKRNKQLIREVEKVANNAGVFVDPSIPENQRLDVIERRLPEIANENDLETLAEIIGLSKMMGAPVHLSSAPTARVKAVGDRLVAKGIRVVYVTPTLDKDGNFDPSDVAGVDPSFATRKDMMPGDVAGYYDPKTATVYINTAQPEGVQIIQGLVHEVTHDVGESYPGGLTGMANMLSSVFPGQFNSYMSAIANMYAKDWATLTPEQRQQALNSEAVATFISQGLSGFMGMALANKEMLSKIGYADPGIMFDMAQTILSVLRVAPESYTRREQAILSGRLESLARILNKDVFFEGGTPAKASEIDGLDGTRVAAEVYRLLNEFLDITGKAVDVAVELPEGGDLQTELQNVMNLRPEDAAAVASDVARREKIVNLLKERKGMGKPIPSEPKPETGSRPSTSSTTGAPPEEDGPKDPVVVNQNENEKLAEKLAPFLEQLRQEQEQNRQSGTVDQNLDDLVQMSEELLGRVQEASDVAALEREFGDLQDMRSEFAPARAKPAAGTTQGPQGEQEAPWKRRRRERAAQRNEANRRANEERRAAQKAKPVEAPAQAETKPVEASKPTAPTKPETQTQGTLPGFFSARVTSEALEKAVAEGAINVGTAKLEVWKQWQDFSRKSNETLKKLNYAEFRDVAAWNKLSPARRKAIMKRNAKAIKEAAEIAARDLEPWLRNNRAMQGYYDNDLKLVKMLWEQIYGEKMTDADLQLFQVLSAILSPSTPLRYNIYEAARILINFKDTGSFGIEIEPYTFSSKAGTKTLKYRQDLTRSVFNLSGTTSANKARSVAILRDMVEDAGGLENLKSYLMEPVSFQEYRSLRQRHGFRGDGSIASIRQVVAAATGQKVGLGKNDTMQYPRAMLYGPKVGAYLLNSLGDSRFQTVDIWESRFIRSYFDRIMFIPDEQIDKAVLRELPTGPEYRLMNMFAAEMKTALEELTGEKFTASQMQALRWFYMLDLARRSGNVKATTNGTVSGYLDAALSRHYGPDYRRSGRGLPESSQVSEVETDAERIANEERFAAEAAVESREAEPDAQRSVAFEGQAPELNPQPGFFSRRVALVSPIGFFDNLDKAISSAPDEFKTESTPDRTIPGRTIDIGKGQTKQIPDRVIKGSRTSAWSKVIDHLSKTPGALRQATDIGFLVELSDGKYIPGGAVTSVAVRDYGVDPKIRDTEYDTLEEFDTGILDTAWNSYMLHAESHNNKYGQTLESRNTGLDQASSAERVRIDQAIDKLKSRSNDIVKLDPYRRRAPYGSRHNYGTMDALPGLMGKSRSFVIIQEAALAVHEKAKEGDFKLFDKTPMLRWHETTDVSLSLAPRGTAPVYEEPVSFTQKLLKAFKIPATLRANIPLTSAQQAIKDFADLYDSLPTSQRKTMSGALLKAAYSPNPTPYLEMLDLVDSYSDVVLKNLQDIAAKQPITGLAINRSFWLPRQMVYWNPEGATRSKQDPVFSFHLTTLTPPNSSTMPYTPGVQNLSMDFGQSRESMDMWRERASFTQGLYSDSIDIAAFMASTFTYPDPTGPQDNAPHEALKSLGNPAQSPTLHAYRMSMAAYLNGFYKGFFDELRRMVSRGHSVSTDEVASLLHDSLSLKMKKAAFAGALADEVTIRLAIEDHIIYAGDTTLGIEVASARDLDPSAASEITISSVKSPYRNLALDTLVDSLMSHRYPSDYDTTVDSAIDRGIGDLERFALSLARADRGSIEYQRGVAIANLVRTLADISTQGAVGGSGAAKAMEAEMLGFETKFGQELEDVWTQVNGLEGQKAKLQLQPTYSTFSMRGDILDYQEHHVTVSPKVVQTPWKDAHPGFETVENPVVRVRFTERLAYSSEADSAQAVANKNIGRVLFIEEIQAVTDSTFKPSKHGYDSEAIVDRSNSIGMRYALNLAAANGFDYVAITKPEDQAMRYWKLGGVVETYATDYVELSVMKGQQPGARVDFFNESGTVMDSYQYANEADALSSLAPKVAAEIKRQANDEGYSIFKQGAHPFRGTNFSYSVNEKGQHKELMRGAVHKTTSSFKLAKRYAGALNDLLGEITSEMGSPKTIKGWINVTKPGLKTKTKDGREISAGNTYVLKSTRTGDVGGDMSRTPEVYDPADKAGVEYEMIDISMIGDKITKTGFGFYSRRLDLAEEMFVDDINMLRKLEDQIAANAKTYRQAVDEADEIERKTGTRPAITVPIAFYNPKTMNFGQMSDLYKGRIGHFNRLAMEQRERIYEALRRGVPLSAADVKAGNKVSAEEYLYSTHAKEANLYLWQERSLQMFNDTAAGQRSQSDVSAAQASYDTIRSTPSASAAMIAAAQNRLSAAIAIRDSLLAAYRGSLAASNPELLSLSGMTDADATRILADAVTEPYYAELQTIRNAVSAIQDLKLSIMEVGGIVSPESVADWRSRYKNYIPLKTTIREPDGSYGAGSGFSIAGAETQKRKGRTSPADDILGHTLVDFSHANSRAMRNTAAQAFMRLIAANPNNPVFTYYGPGEANRRRIPIKDDNRVIAAKFKGEEHYAVINDEDLVRQFKKMGHIDLGNAAAGVVMATRLFSQMQTAWNPAFVLPNFARDFSLATGLMYTDNGVKSAARIVRNVIPAIATLFETELKKTRLGKSRALSGMVSRLKPGKYAKELDEMEQLGAFVAYTDYQSVEEYMAAMRVISTALGSNIGRRALQTGDKYVQPILELVTAANAIAERATRLAAYVEYREMGLSKVQAAAGAKNLTVNFDRKGSAGTAINGLYAFYNPNVQGTANLLRRLGPNAKPEQRRRLMSLVAILGAYGFAQSMINRALAGDDEEGENAYRGKMQEADEKARNTAMILIPDSDGDSVDIPLPWGLNVAYYAGNILERYMAEDISGMDALNNLVGAFVTSFSPVQGATLAQAAVPTVFKPLAEIQLNMKWNGQNVMPPLDPYDRTPIPDSRRHFNTVGSVPKWIAYTLNDLTGGSERTEGEIDISPESIEHMTEFLTGGVGRFWASALGYSWFTREPEQRRFRDLPLGIGAIGGRFYSETDPERRTQSEYFDNMKKIARLQADFEDPRTRDKARQDPTLKVIQTASDFESVIRRLRKAEKEQLSVGNETKAEAMSKLRLAKMRDFNRLYNAAIKANEDK
jgi:hypothetical protein